MSFEKEIEFWVEEFQANAVCKVTYKVTHDQDWVEHGEHGSWVEYASIEITEDKWSIFGADWEPSQEFISRRWREIEDEVTDHYQRECA